MKIEKNLNGLLNSFLGQIDALGYQLDAIGVENQINRHNIIAALMFGQKRLEGELDSLSAKVDTGKAKVESIADLSEKVIKSGVELALFPAKYTYERVKAQF